MAGCGRCSRFSSSWTSSFVILSLRAYLVAGLQWGSRQRACLTCWSVGGRYDDAFQNRGISVLFCFLGMVAAATILFVKAHRMMGRLLECKVRVFRCLCRDSRRTPTHTHTHTHRCTSCLPRCHGLRKSETTPLPRLPQPTPTRRLPPPRRHLPTTASALAVGLRTS